MEENQSSAYLYGNGSGMYFDKDGKEISEMQKYGLSGVHLFIKEYPDSPVYWAIWQIHNCKIPKECLPFLLKYIRKPITIAKITKKVKDDITYSA